MKIQCDVCEKAPATVICCADEAALCSECDVEVHAANKLASKHQRLLLQCLSSKLPPCDICQDKPAFIFCVEDRALFCKDCDEPIHSANSRAANHQRFLATGIRVALGSSGCSKENAKTDMDPKPPKSNSQQIGPKSTPLHVSGITSPLWGVDDLMQFSYYSSSDKKANLEFNELEWLSDMSLFGEQVPEALSAAEVPQLPTSQPNHMISSFRPARSSYASHKKPRLEIPDDDEEFFTVPDLG